GYPAFGDYGIRSMATNGSGDAALAGGLQGGMPDWQPLPTSTAVDCGGLPQAPSDAAAPTITFTAPPDGASYTLNESVTVNYGCADEAGGSGLATCAGTVDGNPVADGAA